MAFDPNSIDPEKVRQLIAKGFKIDFRAGTLEAEHFETNPDPVIAKHEMDALADLAKAMQQCSPDARAFLKSQDADVSAFIESLPTRPNCEKPSTIDDAINAYIASHASLAAGSLKTYKARLGRLADLLGGRERMLHHVSGLDCVNALETYQATAPHASKRKEGNEVEGTLSSGTVKDTLSLWARFFEWATKTKRYPAGPNPIDELPKPPSNATDGGAAAFSSEELAKIFDWSLFSQMNRPHQFWGPLLALFTGCRCNEIAQLRMQDIVIEDGTTCVRIAHDPKGVPPTILKNDASNRTLPLHPTLWKIGMQDYLDDLKEIGATRIFPNLPADKSDKREKYLSRDFNEGHLKKIGVWQSRRKVFHSFRDTVSSRFGRNKIDPAYKDDWLGHARVGVGAKHYDDRLTISEQVKIIFPALDFGLDFSQFKYERGRWNAWLRDHMEP